MEMNDLVIVSIDDHVCEPPDAFIRHYPEAYKSEAPQLKDVNGSDAWVWLDKPYFQIGLNAVVGRPRSEYGIEPNRFSQLRPGVHDVQARVDDMNAGGLLAALNFPTMPTFGGKVFHEAAKIDPKAARRAVRAYNDWNIHDWCGEAPGRMIPMSIVPIWDMQETVAEIERVSKLGVHAITFPESPNMSGFPSIQDSYWEPMWKACVDHQILINCHIGTGMAPPSASPQTPIDAWITTMPISIAVSAADWLWAPMWNRYPELRVALSEGGIGWVPYFLERADFTYDHHNEWTFSDFGDEVPSDVFKRHIVTCFFGDYFGLKNLDSMNEDMICYECDYPHSDSVWPNDPERLWEGVKHLSDQTIDKITHANALRLLNFDTLGILGGRENCTVGHLRDLGKDVDVSLKAQGGFKPEPQRDEFGNVKPLTTADMAAALAKQTEQESAA